MNYYIYMLMYSTIPMMMSMYFMFNNTFISIEITMINAMSFNIPMSMLLDWMSCMFMSTVMFISSTIIMFSMYYMPKKEQKQFSLLLLMFVLSMALLIMSDNMIFILLGWDGLGMSSYILVIYYQNHSTAASGTITILSNRMGDIMILISISTLMINMNWNLNMNKEFTLLTLILIMMASCSKSAQFPFSAWLPAAMAAPTPISALVHSSTLVTAGVFLMIRIMNNPHPSTTMIMMIISSSTAIYASMSANWEQDMKKIIALSTLSQIAMMMFAISLGSLNLAFTHLLIHAMFKSTMFLCAGIMIHNSSYQDTRMLNMTLKSNPLTISIMGLSTMSLMGLPFLSGFFSKDLIMEMLMSSKLYCSMSILMIMSIGLTASYSIRMSMSINKMLMKSNPDSTHHKNNSSILPITILSPMSISMGSVMMWMMNSEQTFHMPFSLKMSILMTLTIGSMLGTMLYFKSKKFMDIGESSLSLWFNHLLTTKTTSPMIPMMNSAMKNDKMWQEYYGPHKLHNLTSKMSISPNTLTLLMMSIIMMMTPLMVYNN